MHRRAVFLPITLSVLLYVLQGCGGGGGSSNDPTNTDDTNNTDNTVDTTYNGYSGSEDQAVVNETNAKDLAIGSASGMKQAVDENGILFPMQGATKALQNLTRQNSRYG